MQWVDTDTREAYRDRGGHAVYCECDIEYRFNRHGYRCPDFESGAHVRVLAIGCSYVMGVGLREEELFHERFAARLRERTAQSVVSWNLGLPGASNDYITRLLSLAVPYLDPHIVLVHFTHAGRREYASAEGGLASYTPGFRPTDRVGKSICRHFEALSSDVDNRLNFFRNYKAAAGLLAGRCWLFSTMEPEILHELAAHADMRRFAGTLVPIDRARDHAHPGPRSHEALMNAYWGRFIEQHDGLLG